MAIDPDAGKHEMHFVSPSGEVTKLMLMAKTSDSIVTAAKSLGARFAIVTDGAPDKLGRMPWGVFDIRRAVRLGGMGWSLEDPIRLFPSEEPDAAVMFAVAKLGSR